MSSTRAASEVSIPATASAAIGCKGAGPVEGTVRLSSGPILRVESHSNTPKALSGRGEVFCTAPAVCPLEGLGLATATLSAQSAKQPAGARRRPAGAPPPSQSRCPSFLEGPAWRRDSNCMQLPLNAPQPLQPGRARELALNNEQRRGNEGTLQCQQRPTAHCRGSITVITGAATHSSS